MNGNCADIERIVWTDGPEAVSTGPLAEHVATCKVCQAQTRQAADLSAALAGLRSHMAPTPTALEPAIFAAIAAPGAMHRARDIVTHPKFWKSAAVGAAAAATAVAGLIVARRLTRPELEADASPELVA